MWVERESMCSAGKHKHRYIYIKVHICVGQIIFDKQINVQNWLVQGQMDWKCSFWVKPNKTLVNN